MKRWLPRSVVFWMGGFMLAFLLWAQWDSWLVRSAGQWQPSAGADVWELVHYEGRLELRRHPRGTWGYLLYRGRPAWGRAAAADVTSEALWRKAVKEGMMQTVADHASPLGRRDAAPGPRSVTVAGVRHGWVIAGFLLLWVLYLAWRRGRFFRRWLRAPGRWRVRRKGGD